MTRAEPVVRGQAPGAGGVGASCFTDRKGHEGVGTGRRDRGRGGRRVGAVPPHQGGLDRRRAARAQAADRRLDVARGRRHAHAQRRPQRRPPAAVHRQPLPRDRGRVRPELQHPPPGRADAGRHAGAARLAAHGAGPRPLPRHAHGPDLDHARPSSSTRCSRSTTSSARSTTRTRGRVDPYGVTHAYAICARNRGAEVYTDTWVTRSAQRADGTWDVITDRATIHAEHVVNCGGLWAREVGRMVGLELPVLAMEHHYLITEPMQEVIELQPQHRSRAAAHDRLRGRDLRRQERPGDPARHVRAEQPAVVAARDAVGLRVPVARPRPRPHRPRARRGFAHFPAVGRAGIQTLRQRTVHVQPRRQPARRPDPGHARHVGRLRGDGRPVAGRRRRPVARQLDGRRRPDDDIWGMDVARYGDWATLAYTNAKVRENYSRRFRITFPNEELPAARPLHTTPIYDRLTEHNAVWGAGFGLEHPLWFQRPGQRPVEDVTFHRSNAFELRRRGVAGRARAGRPERVLQLRQVPRVAATAPPTGCRACSPTGCRRSAART